MAIVPENLRAVEAGARSVAGHIIGAAEDPERDLTVPARCGMDYAGRAVYRFASRRLRRAQPDVRRAGAQVDRHHGSCEGVTLEVTDDDRELAKRIGDPGGRADQVDSTGDGRRGGIYGFGAGRARREAD